MRSEFTYVMVNILKNRPPLFLNRLPFEEPKLEIERGDKDEGYKYLPKRMRGAISGSRKGEFKNFHCFFRKEPPIPF